MAQRDSGVLPGSSLLEHYGMHPGRHSLDIVGIKGGRAAEQNDLAGHLFYVLSWTETCF